MKLSDAIRLGSMTGPQTFGRYETGDATCAVGAAYRAVGLRPIADTQKFRAMFPLATAFNDAPCPVCGLVRVDGVSTAPHLNDHHMWTREQIADWVETIERAHEQQPVEPQPVSVEA